MFHVNGDPLQTALGHNFRYSNICYLQPTAEHDFALLDFILKIVFHIVELTLINNFLFLNHALMHFFSDLIGKGGDIIYFFKWRRIFSKSVKIIKECFIKSAMPTSGNANAAQLLFYVINSR